MVASGECNEQGAKQPFFSGGAGDSATSHGERGIGPGAEVGPYKLIGVLAEGGYGVVYLASQDRPIRRRVALKIVKPGMDSKQVIARFEAERQALALLDHPNIAHIYDAGATPAGHPYFAMEFIEGLPITEYCDRQKLTIRERLRLFIQVCDGVQHAHQKGIIHRDLKPSNILVTTKDDRPLVKVIDFGIAKALTQPLTERTLYTEQGQFVGTPDYMSPEQAQMDGYGMDTRSDVYSLGVVLYELLTGVLPFDPADLRSGGVDHIRAVIREHEPRTPSTRLTSLGAGLAEIAQRRGTDPRTLARTLRRELEWIPLKAMRKEPSRRYQSSAEFAGDIEDYLQDRPLLAGPESRTYRAKKLIRRHVVSLVVAAVVVASLAIGLAVSTVSLIREQQARRVAVAAQEKETAQRQRTEALAYASDMSLAQQAMAMNDLGRARRLLEDHRPKAGEVDLRGWEWRYLWQQCQSDALGEVCRYPGSVTSVAYSPDGRVLAVAGYGQNFVDLWDVSGRKRIATLEPKEGHIAAFSPRGDLLATDSGRQIRLWRTSTWDPVGELTLAASIQAIKFSPDGTLLASLSDPDELTVWEVDRWTIVLQKRDVKPSIPHLGWVDFSPDGKALAIGDADHHVQVVDLANGDTVLDIPEAHAESITRVAWSPNGSVIASGSGYRGGPIRLWDAASGKPVGALEAHTSWISQLIFSADGRRLYSAGADQTIRIWDVDQQRCLATLRGASDEVWGLALSPDSATLVSSSRDGVVAFWSALVQPEEQMPRLIALGEFARPAFAPAGQVLAMPRGGIVSLLDLTTFEEIEQLPALGSDVYIVVYSADGTLLVSGSRSGLTRVWSCAERRLLQELGAANVPAYPLGFAADGRWLLSVDAKHRAVWWDTLTWQTVRTSLVGPSYFGAVSPDGRLLALGDTQAIHWLNAETGELLEVTPSGHRDWLQGIAFSSNGSQAASVDTCGTVAIWDSSSFKLIAAFKGHMHGTHAVAFSPDGRRLATSGDGSDAVKLWDLRTHRELTTIPGHGSVFESVSFSPDGRWLAACNREGQLHLWHASSWKEIEAVEKRRPNGQSP